MERKMRKMGSAVGEKIAHLIEHAAKKIISSSRLFISKFHLVQGTRQIEKPNSIGNISMIISICGGIYSLQSYEPIILIHKYSSSKQSVYGCR